MAEPQPPIQAGSAAAAAEGENPTLKPASKDDAKAAAALSSLDARGDDADTASKPGDKAALTSAMKDLKVDGGVSEAKAAPKKIKIDAKDVALIVEHCELSKNKATELLRASEGQLLTALSRFIDGKA